MRRVWFAWLSVVVGCPRGGGEAPEPCMTWRATAGECVRSAITETAVEDPLLVQLTFTYDWPGAPTRPFAPTWTVPRSRLAAVRAALGETAACERMWAPRCEAWILPTEGVRTPAPGPGLADRERVCPPHSAPLNPGVVAIVPAALAASLGATSGAWQRTAVTSEVDRAEAIYARGDEQVRVTVEDRIHACTGAADATDLLLDTEAIADAGTTRRRVRSATSAVLVTWLPPNAPPKRWQVVMWIGGRCRAEVERVTRGSDPDVLVEVGRTLDVAALERACAAR